MLDIIELSGKNRDDLVVIAKELEVHKPESLDKETLIYAILDQQAVVSKEDPKKRQTRKNQNQKKKADKNTQAEPAAAQAPAPEAQQPAAEAAPAPGPQKRAVTGTDIRRGERSSTWRAFEGAARRP